MSTASASRRRLGRRGVAAGVLSLALVGGGAAYAGYQQWYSGGGDGVTCFTRWSDLSDARQNLAGGPELTGDPVTDCQRYQHLTGHLAIEDPVAFHRNGQLLVGPRSQVPKGTTILAGATRSEAAARELTASLGDWVDGGRSRCLSQAQATAFAEGELKRLALQGWRVEVTAAETTYPCSEVWTDDTQPGTVVVRPRAMEDPDVVKPAADVNPAVYVLRDALRSRVADRCLSLAAATEIATRAVGSQHHWPLMGIADSKAACTRVDLEVGGSIQVTLRGPATAKP